MKKEIQNFRQEKIKNEKGEELFMKIYKRAYFDLQEAMVETGNRNIYELFMLLTQYANKFNALIMSYQTMESFMGLSRATIHKAIKVLEKYEFIKIAKTGNSNVYSINDKYAWSQTNEKKWSSTYRNGKFFRYTQIQANVVMTDIEQTKWVQDKIEEEILYETDKNGNTILDDGSIVSKDGEILGYIDGSKVEIDVNQLDLLNSGGQNDR